MGKMYERVREMQFGIDPDPARAYFEVHMEFLHVEYTMRRNFQKSISFVTALSTDPRIPKRDKAVLVGMLALLLSPFDIVPDFIPVLGQLDDLMILILLFDYVCNRVPDEVLKDHFPWDPSQVLAWRRRIGFFVKLVPHWVKDKIWKAGDHTVVVEGTESRPTM